MNSFEQSNIWKSAFERSGEEQLKERLSSALNAVRENASVLGSKIAADFPSLTVHDITHMDALWDVADLLVGPDHGLNPLEVFVLGCTFYLHDAALCFEAYEGGRDAIRQTDVWKDANWRHKQAGQKDLEAKKNADFDAIRTLHAQQAEKIAYEEWRVDENGESFFVIEDRLIREHHGRLIGKLAASHHWDIHQVEEQLQNIQSPVVGFPNNWTIRPLLLACILRCADAAQIDGTRAPETLLCLLKASGVSQDHWRAQNRIGAVSRLENSSKLLISTTKPFAKNDASAWWVMYDNVQIVERELATSNALLIETYGSEIALLADGVDSNSGPKELSRRIQTEGWEPTNATVKVGDVERVVGALGGQQLYGADDILAVVARELVQNAIDAVSARRAFDVSFDANVEISIELLKHPLTENWVLRVADKGVGMSPAVLLNSLLDFGSSFWKSPKASEEFPGMQSKDAQIIGRFGIGFFSVFSIAKSVRVFSRRFDAARQNYRCLEFPSGLTLRPLHSSDAPEAGLRGFSTIVEVEISPDQYDGEGEFEVKANHQGQKSFCVPFTDFISSMICDIRVGVEIKHGDNIRHLKAPTEFNTLEANELLERMTFEKPSEQAKNLIISHASRMRAIQHNGKTFGFAALTTVPINGYHYVSAKTIDGLTTPHNRGTDSYIGWMEAECRSAKRDVGELEIPEEALSLWVAEQVKIYQSTNPDLVSRFVTAGHIESLGGDPRSVLDHIMCYQPDGNGFAFIKLSEVSTVMNSHQILVPVNEYGGLDQYCRNPAKAGAFVVVPHFRAGRNYMKANLENGRPTDANSLISLITESAENSGKAVSWERQPGVFESAFGRSDALALKFFCT
ncbi:ATP-binding protein [Ruegeria lacuscaerulensis]|uniref:HD domain-containing protein n=1 Tax=Ruegeria lacuscaerulensis TaxID=55218 RepID=UPI0014818E27|nr:ATP-binding protein [Ruegeria lacuscaerulensis]